MRSLVVLGKQFCGFLLIENQILNCLIVELTNCRKNDKKVSFLGYYFVIELLSSKFSPHSQVL